MSNHAEFFIAGTPLHADALSYVTRPADEELLQHVLEGALCSVLAARQMGKSSLMARTAQHLRARGVKTVEVSLRAMSATAPDQWYLAVLSCIARDLDLAVEIDTWWRSHEGLGAPQRFTDFLRDVVLEEVEWPVVVFIDDVEATLGLDFRDDFFAAIRATYNARANDPIYNRLTFVLLGSATPLDLIQDRNRTPFNIGRRIGLREFTPSDVTPLCIGLDARHPEHAGAIITRILYWTGGQPYLTHKLCLAAADAPMEVWPERFVDQLVNSVFFSPDGRSDAHFIGVRSHIRTLPPALQQSVLKRYSDIYNEKPAPHSNGENPSAQQQLELLGLVREEHGQMRVHNRVYRHIFDDQWVRGPATFKPPRLTTAIVSGVVVLLAALIALGVARGAVPGAAPPTPTAPASVRRTLTSAPQVTQEATITAPTATTTAGSQSGARARAAQPRDTTLPTEPAPVAPTPQSLPTTPLPTTATIDAEAALLDEQEAQLIARIDQLRRENNCAALTLSSALTSTARNHSADMAANDFLSPIGSNRLEPLEQARELGYTGESVRANVGYSVSAPGMVELWMESATTRAQMLDCAAEDIGVGWAQGNGTTYWTVIFGRRS
jgi:uncharacterized protein YkwD